MPPEPRCPCGCTLEPLTVDHAHYGPCPGHRCPDCAQTFIDPTAAKHRRKLTALGLPQSTE